MTESAASAPARLSGTSEGDLQHAVNSPSADLPPAATTASIVIASTPRSGSSLVGTALWATGVAGAPSEYLHPRHRADWGRRGVDVSDVVSYLHTVARHRTSPNGRFGVKVHFSHFADEVLAIGHDLKDVLPTWPPQVVWTRRRNTVLQAISFSIAIQTKSWSASRPEAAEPVYDARHIAHQLLNVTQQERNWGNWFRSRGVTPLEVVYEELDADYDGVMTGVLAFLGLEAEIPERQLRKQGNDRNERWAERFLDDVKRHGTETILRGGAA